MGLSLKPRNLKRYKDLARLFLKYGRSDLLRSTGLDEALNGEMQAATPESVAEAHELAGDLEKLGATYIKLGQLLSTRGDLLPPACADALARLQDKVEQVPYEQIEHIVTTELGVRMSRGFLEFEVEPLAAASLGQVHRARMRDGRPVVVKVQRPGIRERIAEDMEALEGVADLLDAHTEIGKRYQFGKILDEFRRTIYRELDYRQEARNLSTLAENLKEYDRIVVPLPVDDYTTSRVITMEYVRGQKVTSVGPLVRVELDGPLLLEQLFQAYLQQVLVDGFLHADPHPGNVFLTEDGRLALIDLGMVVRISGDIQEKLLELMLAIGDGRGDEAAQAVFEIGRPTGEVDREELRRKISDLVGQNAEAKLEELEIGRVLVKIARTAGEAGLQFPSEISMVGQTLLKLDNVGRILAPDFKPNDAIRRNAMKTMRGRMLKNASLGALFKGAVEFKNFITNLPSRVNQILELVSSNQLEIRVDSIDETRIMEGFQKIANRITLGLVLAALIVGAALLMRVETSFRILGYPGLAMLLFLAAAVGGFGLVLNIVFRDDHRRRGDGEAHRKSRRAGRR